ncbi:family 20 glycosylhydrolase [Dyella agri]|uniref:N-acetyl-beta-glucosaminidase n=2 Tax=Dyella agri TaxID=1926869 RepID=A0ABW8KD84_9GAMM
MAAMLLAPVIARPDPRPAPIAQDATDIHIVAGKIATTTQDSDGALSLAGSDHLPIVDASGSVHAPLVATSVTLYFKRSTPGTKAADLSKTIVAPGIHADAGVNAKPFVIPALKEWYGGEGDFRLRASSRIVIGAGHRPELLKLAKVLQQDLRELTGRTLSIVDHAGGPGDIRLSLKQPDASIGAEGYYLAIGKDVTVSATAYQGAFWGTRTLLQLLERSPRIPQGTARDYPEFAVRGLVLDVARKFFRMRFLRDYVKLLSYYKLNDFQIHLNDNGSQKLTGKDWHEVYAAFRLENDTYPQLTAKDGSYTKAEFRALQRMAMDRSVRIVPEIDTPAHALALTRARPDIGSAKFGLDHLDLHNRMTSAMVENIFREYLAGPHPVFTGPVVDIGTDEYAKADAEAFRAYTDRMIRFVGSYGKKVRMWGALTWASGTTPVTTDNVTMDTWYNGYADPVVMKQLGYPQISSPDDWLYIVPAAGYYNDYLDLPKLYRDWTPDMVGNVSFLPGDPAIVGGSFAVWNDIIGNGISEKDVNDRVFPALQVLAQKMWNGANTDMDYEHFAALSRGVGEGPGLNLRGRMKAGTLAFDFDHPSRNVRLHRSGYGKGVSGHGLRFGGADSYATLPYEEIGYDYTVSFWINPSSRNADDAMLFRSANSQLKLRQGATDKLGFSRDGYDFSFDYSVPANTWTHIVITGTSRGTDLYVNGVLHDHLYDAYIQFNGEKKEHKRLVQTLFFPLRRAGGFRGAMDELKVWNRVLSAQEIRGMDDGVGPGPGDGGGLRESRTEAPLKR